LQGLGACQTASHVSHGVESSWTQLVSNRPRKCQPSGTRLYSRCPDTVVGDLLHFLASHCAFACCKRDDMLQSGRNVRCRQTLFSLHCPHTALIISILYGPTETGKPLTNTFRNAILRRSKQLAPASPEQAPPSNYESLRAIRLCRNSTFWSKTSQSRHCLRRAVFITFSPQISKRLLRID
jgi:hypothetical protein